MTPETIRDLADTLCLPITAFWKHNNKMCTPFYDFESDILKEYTKRKLGLVDIPTGEYVIASSINHFFEKRDVSGLDKYVHSMDLSNLSFNEQEILIHGRLKALPKLKELYGGNANI